jgi:hypothetical protein
MPGPHHPFSDAFGARFQGRVGHDPALASRLFSRVIGWMNQLRKHQRRRKTMSTTSTTNTAPAQTPAKSDKPKTPDWIVKTPKGYGRKERLERIGAAWNREDGGICIRVYGTQVISADIYLFPLSEAEPAEG